MTVMELENICLEFGERISEMIAEKEISGEMEIQRIKEIDFNLSKWERQTLELCSILKLQGIVTSKNIDAQLE